MEGCQMAWRLMIAVLVLATAIGVVVERAVTDIQIRPISSLGKGDLHEGTVAIKGRILYAHDNRFVVADPTGKAELTTCPVWYRRIGLHVGDKVTVIGEILTAPPIMHDCDVTLSALKVFRGDETIVVRGRPGKPPWAEGPVALPSPNH